MSMATMMATMSPEVIIQEAINRFDTVYLEFGSSYSELNTNLNEFYNFIDSKIRAIYFKPSVAIHGLTQIVSIVPIEDSDEIEKIYYAKLDKVQASM